MSTPAFEVTFAAPDPVCGHETSWRSSMWWDFEAGCYRSADVVTACECVSRPVTAPQSEETASRAVQSNPNQSQGLTGPRTEK